MVLIVRKFRLFNSLQVHGGQFMNFDNAIIDKQSPIPLYYQLKEILLKRILHADNGDMLPTENTLCDIFEIVGGLFLMIS